MVRFLIIIVCVTATSVGCTYTRRQQDATRDTVATVGTFVGIPRPLGEAIGSAIAMAVGAFAGHKNGRKKERKAAAREKCVVQHAVADAQSGKVVVNG